VNRALVYLAWIQRRNATIAFFAGLREPRRAIVLLLSLALLSLFVTLQSLGRSTTLLATGARDSLSLLFAVLLVTSAANGLLQRGLTFLPADVDFVFPGPFARHEIVLYRLVTLYPVALLSSALFLLFFRHAAGNLLRAYAGIVLLQFVAAHLQAISGLLAVRASEARLARIRGPARAFVYLLAVGGAIAFLGAALGISELGSDLLPALRGSVWSWLLAPALAAADLVVGDSLAGALRPAFVLVATALATGAIAIFLPVDFLEASLGTTERGARRRADVGRGVVGAEPHHAAVRSRAPTVLLRGASALAWKNLVTASRSWRYLLLGVAFMGFYTALMMARVKGPGGGGGVFDAVAFGAMWPLLMHQYLAFDFRRDLDAIPLLRQLPASPFAVAFAQVAVPSLLCLALQGFGLLAVAIVAPFPPFGFVLAAVAFPPITLLVMTVTNLGFLLFPTRQGAAGRGRGAVPAASGVAIFNMIVLALLLAPAFAVGWWRVLAGDPTWLAVTFGAATLLAIDALMLALLGGAFVRFDLAEDVS
jgi:hypothetical protein